MESGAGNQNASEGGSAWGRTGPRRHPKQVCVVIIASAPARPGSVPPDSGVSHVTFRLALEGRLAHRAAEQVFLAFVFDDDMCFVAVDSLAAHGVAVVALLA